MTCSARLRLLVLPLLALVLLALPGFGFPQAGGDLRLGDEIRAGIRWLRSAQDPKDGSYGGGVPGTAWALRAFAESPDQYRAVDGPFVRKGLDFLRLRQAADGTIADEKAEGEERLAQTRAAAAALTLYADATTTPTLQAALRRLAGGGLEGPGWEPP